MIRFLRQLLNGVLALILGSGVSAVYALTESDFTNQSGVQGSSMQHEENSANNTHNVLVLPKGMTVTKTADASALSSPTQAGDVIAYQIAIENIGLLTLSNIQWSDSIIPAASMSLLSGDTDFDNELDADEIWIVVGNYAVTQTDLDTNGGGDADIDNTVTVSTNELADISDSVAVPIVQDSKMAIAKQVDSSTIGLPTTLNYEIELSNTGNTSLTGVAIDDTLPDGSTAVLTGPLADTGAVGVLDVGETWLYTVSHFVDQAVIDTGATLVNTATATSAETGAVSVSDTAETTIVNAPSFTLAKVVDEVLIDQPGTLSYSITLFNDGNRSLNSVQLNDTLPDGSAGVLVGPIADIGSVGVLDVGESWEFIGSYYANQADIDAGADLINTISATSAETVSTPSTVSATTSVEAAPELTVSKVVDQDSIAAPLNLIYSIAVENTGNLSLDNIVLNDTLPNGTPAVITGPNADIGQIGKLDVGERWEYTASYSVTQLDIDEGLTLTNTVTATSNQTSPALATDTALTTITRSPEFSVSKVVDQATVTQPSVLAYQIEIQNTGNTSLSSINITDTMPDGTAGVLTGPSGDAMVGSVLDVGETWVYTTQYTVSQDDINAGVDLVNEIDVTTFEAGGVSSRATTVVSQTPGLNISKQAVDTFYTAAGDTVNFDLLIVNNGNVGLADLTISDPLADPGSVNCAQAEPFQLLPGQSVACSAVVTVTADHVAATELTNQASVSGIDSLGADITAQSVLATVVMDRIPPVAVDEAQINNVSTSITNFTAAADDTDLNGDIDITTAQFVGAAATDSDGDGDNDSLQVANEGQWAFDNTTGEASFTPEVGFTGDPTPVSYTVSDATSLVSNTALLIADYPQSAPVATDDYMQNPLSPSPSNPTALNVLAANGGLADSDPENDLDASTVSFISANAVDTDGDGDSDSLLVAGEGQWVVDQLGNVIFTPVAGFLADPAPISYKVSDITGLSSNVAVITIEYPQTAPVAVDDERFNQPLGQAVVLSVLDNDTDIENNIDPTSVRFADPDTGLPVTSLVVAGEGSWAVDTTTGEITFTPEPGFLGNPAPVPYRVVDTTGVASNWAMVTITFEAPAALEGIVWVDADRDGNVDADEARKADWTLRVIDSNGNVVATAVTNANGEYSISGLIPAAYVVEFYNEQGVFMDSQTTRGVLSAGETINLPLPVDPGGVVYDSISRAPVGGVTLTLVNETGVLVDEACLAGNQQSQVTDDDGLYSFNLNVGQHFSCPPDSVYRIQIAQTPSDYYGNFSSIIRQEGANSCGSPILGCAVSDLFDASSNEAGCTFDALPGTSACEVQAQPDAPQGNDDTRYFVEFLYNAGDRSVVFNHLPVDLRANDAEILLSKGVDKRAVSIGDVLQYTITAQNTKAVPAFDVSVLDTPPAGFTFVESSVRLHRVGADGVFDTSDDQTTSLNSTGRNPVEFDLIDINPEESVRITYLMRVGVGVIAGNYVNSARATGPSGDASNVVSVPVEVISDPVLNQATLIGKVFHDRDEDGVQDSANASGVLLGSDYYGWDNLGLPPLPGRRNINENPSKHAITVNMPIGESNRFKILTSEGSRITVDENGNVTEAHVGDKARGFNSQDIRVCTQRTEAIPTYQNQGAAVDNKITDVLKIVISNHGIDETGIPGVRLATVTGLLIETDAYGRYSIPDVDAGDTDIGQNFVLKVDPASLPDGSRFTTENPYVLRIINSTLNRINFGVAIDERDRFNDATSLLCEQGTKVTKGQSVEVKLGSVFFDSDDASVREDQLGIVRDIIKKLQTYGGGKILIESSTDSRGRFDHNLRLAEKRAKIIEQILRSELGADKMKSVSVEVNPAAYQESGK